jgi:hypothetical protein
VKLKINFENCPVQTSDLKQVKLVELFFAFSLPEDGQGGSAHRIYQQYLSGQKTQPCASIVLVLPVRPSFLYRRTGPGRDQLFLRVDKNLD